MTLDTDYDVAIIGGGASGTALLYVLSKYANIKRIVLLEKYAALGSVNSNAKNNSQTLHVGDIETNYAIEKVREVKPAAMMVKRYAESLPSEEGGAILHPVQKMVLAVGNEEVAELRSRFEHIKELFPEVQLLEADALAAVEPEVMRGRAIGEPVAALFNPKGFSVNFGLLAQSLARNAQGSGTHIEIMLKTRVERIEHKDETYLLHTDTGIVNAPIVIVDTDAYSLGFAKSLGYGKEFSLIPVAGSFYFSPEKLRGKVYRVQEKRMPFAAVHGDPDLTRSDSTRWGPTARFYPVLEAGKIGTMRSFFASAGLHRPATWVSMISILLEPIRLWYLVKNFFFDLPIIGKYFFLPQVRAIIPTMKASDLEWVRGYGGMRLQRVNTRTRELLLGEGKIVGENIIFNMSPSPGASVCLYNAMRDADQIVQFDPSIEFDKRRMLDDLCEGGTASGGDPSLPESYAS